MSIKTKFLILFVIIAGGCSGPSTESTTVEQPVVQSRNDLPKMIITTLGETKVNIRELKGNIILVLFQPDCDHCQREAKDIRERLDAFTKYTLYFISAGQAQAIEKFGRDYDLIGQPNVFFATTTVDFVINNFGSIPTPSLYIYSDQKLVQKYNGEVAIEKILQSI